MINNFSKDLKRSRVSNCTACELGVCVCCLAPRGGCQVTKYSTLLLMIKLENSGRLMVFTVISKLEGNETLVRE